jgi:hypothetical protein
MPWQENRNRNSLSPHGQKEMQGHGARGVHDINSVPCREMGPGLLSMSPLNSDPHRAGPKMNPYAPESSRRPVGEPSEIKPPHNPAPHVFGGDRKEPNTYGKVPHR